MSEQSLSVHEGSGYDVFYLSRHESKEDLTQSPARESSAHPPIEGEEGYEEDEGEDGDKGEEGYDEEGGGDGDKGEEGYDEEGQRR